MFQTGTREKSDEGNMSRDLQERHGKHRNDVPQMEGNKYELNIQQNRIETAKYCSKLKVKKLS